MSCKNKQDKIDDLKSKGISTRQATDIVDKIAKMTLGQKETVMRHPYTNAMVLLNSIGVNAYLNKVVLNKISKENDTYVLTGVREDGKSYTMRLGSEGYTVDLNNGIKLDRDKLDVLINDFEYLNNTNGYENLVTDMLNDPTKIVGMAEELAKDTDVVLNEGYKNQLIGNLQSIVGPLKDMQAQVNIHLNKREKELHGQVVLTGKNVDVWIADNVDGRTKSKLETYVHELYHAVTSYALKSNDPKFQWVKRQIADVREEFLDKISAEKLVELSAKEVGEVPLTLEQANSILDYVSNRSTGLEEFVAHAMTNKPTMRALYTIKTDKKEEHPDLVSKVIAMIRNAIELVTRKLTKAPKTNNDYEQMVWLVNKLTTTHQKHAEKRKPIVIENILSYVSHIEESIVGYYTNYSKKQEDKIFTLPKNANSFQKGLYLGKLTYNAMFNEQSKRILETSLSGRGSIFHPESTISTAIRDMSTSDAQQDLAEYMGLMSQQIDQGRKFRDTVTRIAINKAFDRELDQTEWELISDVLLDTDAGLLLDVYDDKLLDLMDQNNLNSEIQKYENAIKKTSNNKDYNYYKYQMKGLADYMVIGSADIAQLLNARNIAKKLNADKVDTVSEQLVKDIDILTSLYALKKVGQEKRDRVKLLMSDQPNGIGTVLAYQQGIRNKAEEELFPTEADKVHMIKGHTAELYADDRELIAAPMTERKRLEQQGWKFVKKLTRHELDRNQVEVGQFITNTQVKQSFNTIAMRMTDKHRVGTTITESYGMTGHAEDTKALAKADITKLIKLQAKIVEEQKNGTYKRENSTNNLLPLQNIIGDTVDFRYVMLKKDKKNLLGMDRRANHVLGKTYANMYDKSTSAVFNDKMMEIIKKDAKENYVEDRRIGKNLKEYIEVKKDSHNKEVKDLWNILPDKIKRENPNGIVVRRDLMYSYLGFRDMSLGGSDFVKRLHPTVQYAIHIGEKLWQEIIRITKADIIIRMPSVILGNIWSNLLIPIMMGENPVEVTKLTLEGVRELTEYVKGIKQLVDIEAKEAAGIATKEDLRRKNTIKENLDKSAVKDLVDAGFYTSIVEELETEVEDKGLIARFLNDKLESTPRIVRDGLNLLYLTENSLPFKLISVATQYSDFSARYAQYHLSVRRGIDKDKALKQARDYYVNYHKPNGRFLEWANQMGFVMFTKYFTRIQKAIRDYGTTHPLKALLFITGQYAYIGDVGDITDQSLLVKDLSILFYNPFEAPLNVITPSGYEWMRDSIKAIS